MSEPGFHIQWNDFANEVSNHKFGFRLNDDFSDTTIWCQTSDGRMASFRSHKFLLLMSSLYFRQMLLNNPSNEPELFLDGDGFSSERVKLALDFVYDGEVVVSEADLNSFLEVVQKLKVRGIYNDFEEEEAAAAAGKSNSATKPEPDSSSPDKTSLPCDEKETGAAKKNGAKKLAAAEKAKAAGSDESSGSGEKSDQEKVASAATTEVVDKKAKKPKEKKDPNAPKKPQTAYIFFSAEQGKKLREEHPDMNFSEVSKAVSNAWSELSADDKVAYEEKAAADKERYSKEMETYSSLSSSSKSPPAADDKSKEGKEKKDPHAPKKPQTAYSLFRVAEVKKIREVNPEKSAVDVTKEVAARWAAIEPDDKRSWEEKAAQDKDRFERETAAYNSEAKED